MMVSKLLSYHINHNFMQFVHTDAFLALCAVLQVETHDKYMRSLIAIRISDQLNLIKNDSVFTNLYISCLMLKQKYGT